MKRRNLFKAALGFLGIGGAAASKKEPLRFIGYSDVGAARANPDAKVWVVTEEEPWEETHDHVVTTKNYTLHDHYTTEFSKNWELERLRSSARISKMIRND